MMWYDMIWYDIYIWYMSDILWYTRHCTHVFFVIQPARLVTKTGYSSFSTIVSKLFKKRVLLQAIHYSYIRYIVPTKKKTLLWAKCVITCRKNVQYISCTWVGLKMNYRLTPSSLSPVSLVKLQEFWVPSPFPDTMGDLRIENVFCIFFLGELSVRLGVALSQSVAGLLYWWCRFVPGNVVMSCRKLYLYIYTYIHTRTHKKWCKPNYEFICWALLFNTTKKVNLQIGVNWRWLTSVFATLHHLIIFDLPWWLRLAMANQPLLSILIQGYFLEKLWFSSHAKLQELDDGTVSTANPHRWR